MFFSRLWKDVEPSKVGSHAAAHSTGMVRRKVTHSSFSIIVTLHPAPLHIRTRRVAHAVCAHTHTRTSLSHAQEWAPSAPEPTGRIFFAWEWGHLVCSVVPVVAKSRLVQERDGLLHMPRWELVVMHVLSLLSNLIIWHIRYEPRFLFRCGLE